MFKASELWEYLWVDHVELSLEFVAPDVLDSTDLFVQD